MPVAYNSQSGEGLTLGPDNSWQKAKVAKNSSGDVKIFDGKEWQDIKKQQQESSSEKDSSAERFGTGMRDPLEGATQDLYNVTPKPIRNAVDTANNYLSDKGFPLAKIPPGGMNQFEKQREAKIQDSRGGATGTDWARTSGNVASTLGLSALMPEVKGAGTLMRMGKTLLGSTASGALTPATSDDKFSKEKKRQMELGAASGLAGGMAAEGVAKAIAPKFDKSVKVLLDNGVKLTPGQLSTYAAPFIKRGESALKSVPLVGGSLRDSMKESLNSFNNAVMNRVLKPIGEKLPKTVAAGRDALAHVEDRLNDSYEKLLPKLTFKMDMSLVNDMKILEDRASTFLPEGQLKQLKNMWLGVVEPRLKNGVIDGSTFKKVESELSYEARQYAKATDPAQRALSQYINEMRGVLRQGLIRTNPEQAKDLSKIDQAWSMFSRARDASVRRAKAGEDPGIFTPSDLVNTIKQSSPRSVFARGDYSLQDLAEAGHQVIPDIVPDSGTTERALWTMLMTGGATFNPYVAAGAAAATIPYTKPGMAVINAIARPGPTREAARRLTEKAVPSAGIVGSDIANAPSQ